jgi:hypothetical protein
MFKKADVLYLHIGTHKTGSSALQRFFKLNDKLLSKHGILYPVTFREAGGRHGNFSRSLDFDWPPENSKKFADYIDDLKKEIKGHKKIVISDEALWLEENLDRLQLLYQLAETVKIIVYFRRQDDYLQSSYSQAVKIECKESIEDYVKIYDYKAVCDRWAKVFSKENICVRPYERQQFKDESIFSDFLSIIDVELTDDFKFPKKNFNPTLNIDALNYKLLINKLHCGKFSMIIFFRPFLDYTRQVDKKGLFHSHDFISPQKQLDIIEAHRELNSALAREYLDREDGQLFYESEPDVKEAWEPYKGLTEQKKDEISEFIAKNYLLEALLIRRAIKLTMHLDKHKDPEVLRAANELRGIFKFVTFRNMAQAFMREVIRQIKKRTDRILK